jgi:hypothetical protein
MRPSWTVILNENRNSVDPITNPKSEMLRVSVLGRHVGVWARSQLGAADHGRFRVGASFERGVGRGLAPRPPCWRARTRPPLSRRLTGV